MKFLILVLGKLQIFYTKKTEKDRVFLTNLWQMCKANNNKQSNYNLTAYPSVLLFVFQINQISFYFNQCNLLTGHYISWFFTDFLFSNLLLPLKRKDVELKKKTLISNLEEWKLKVKYHKNQQSFKLSKMNKKEDNIPPYNTYVPYRFVFNKELCIKWMEAS